MSDDIDVEKLLDTDAALSYRRSSDQGPARRAVAPISRFSSTVRLGKSRRPSGTIASPARTI